MSIKKGIIPYHLRCEYKLNPVGIDVLTPRFSWLLTSLNQKNRGEKQSAYWILVADCKRKLDMDEGNLWDTGKIESEDMNQIEYQGKPLNSRMECWWKVMVWDQDGFDSIWSESAYFSMGLLQPGDWKAQWIGYHGPVPEDYLNRDRGGLENKDELILPPPVYLRKSFYIFNKPIRRAMAYVTALGIYELRINNHKVGDYDRLTPGWSEYRKRVYYQTYNVSHLLKINQENIFGSILADGWYAGYYGYQKTRNHYGKETWFLMQLEIEYQDGTRDILTSNPSWKANFGPIMEADLLQGEVYDARKELNILGWEKSRYNETTWYPVSVSNPPPIMLEAYPGIPVQRIQTIKAKSMTEPKPGLYVYDLGQNMVGIVQLKIKGKLGSKIIIRHGEAINPDGTLYTANLRSARAVDVYYLKGEGIELWSPRFTFHGFRYVEISGCSMKPGLDAISGFVLHNGIQITGNFRCSNPMVNQLMKNIQWGQRGNYLEVPMDCPQRDERLGWTGDAQVFIRTGAYTMDIAPFFTKWLVDLNDAQRKDGSYPDVAPEFNTGSGTPGWGDAGIICPYTMYRMYGDKRVLETYYPRMKKLINYLKSNSKKYIRPDSGYGDWVSLNADTPKDLIGTAYFAYVTRLMAEIAQVLEKNKDADQYQKLVMGIKKAFIKTYIRPDGRIKGNTQTAYLLALGFDLLPEELHGNAVDYLLEDLESRDWHLSTGFLGTPLLLPVLTRFGHKEIAYRLLLNETYPSWGYPVKHGATTIWERWNGWTEKDGFYDPGMNSFNHYAYGCVGEWIYSKLGGIDISKPGFQQVLICPHFDLRINHARTIYHSIRGIIKTHWKMDKDKTVLEVDIPVNTSALIHIPMKRGVKVQENGIPVGKAKGIKMISMNTELMVLEIGSGEYHFELGK